MPAGVGDQRDAVTLVAVPGGVWHGGLAAREVGLRAVDGEDELFVLDSAAVARPGERATALIARCLGEPAVVRDLTLGDREALLLHLRRLSVGEVIDAIVRCPAASCGAVVELTIPVRDLLVPAYADACPAYELRRECAGASYAVSFRLPTAGDLDRALTCGDAEAAAAALLRACVIRAVRDGESTDVDALPTEVRTAIDDAMLEHDAQAELELEARCPSCGSSFTTIFDAGAFLLRELEERAAGLLREVHLLASAYHWSEREILRMPPQRRSRYLELVGEAARGAAR